MKKILFISQHYPPEFGAASNRIQQVVDQLIKNDYTVYIVTPKPNYPNPQMYKNVDLETINNENLKVYRTSILTTSLLSEKRLRMINQLLFLFLSFFISAYLLVRYSIKTYVNSSPPFILNINGLLLKVLLRRKWVLEVRDLWPDSALAVQYINTGAPVNSYLYKLLKKMELLFYRKADKIIVVTNSSKKIVIDQEIAEEKIHIITNGIPNWAYKIKKSKYPNNNEYRICYIGNLGLSQNLKITLDVANRFKQKKEFQFYFVGEGLAKKGLIEYKNQLKLDNVHFIAGILDKNKIADWYMNTDLGIISLENASLFESVIPSKLFEYAAFHIPILYIGKGEAAEIISTYKLGVSVQTDVEQIALEIEDMRRNSPADDNQRQMFLQEYSWENLIKKYMDVIK